MESAEGPVRWLLLNAEANVEIDITAVDAQRSTFALAVGTSMSPASTSTALFGP